MHTYQASVRAQVRGRSQVIRTEVRALNAQDARWLLWAQWGFHSIQSGPTQVKTQIDCQQTLLKITSSDGLIFDCVRRNRASKG
jgi:hypothetical protein